MFDWYYESQLEVLNPGSTLLLYTDGLTEAMDAKHRQYGLQRVKGTVARHITAPPQQLLDVLRADCEQFVDGAEQSDDLTMLAVSYTPAQEVTELERELKVTNDVKHVPEVNDFITVFCQDVKMDESLATQMQLAVEEAVVNIMNYAYPEGEQGDIFIKASATAEHVKFVLTDHGAAFAPTDAPDVDTSLSAEDRQIGGLGIFLVRQLMDTINYERVDNRNVLTLTKKRN